MSNEVKLYFYVTFTLAFKFPIIVIGVWQSSND